MVSSEHRELEAEMKERTLWIRGSLARSARGAALAAGAFALLALQPGLAPARTARATALAACPTHGLAIWLNTQGSGTAGAVYYRVELTNLSGRKCMLVGYPRVNAVDLAGRQVGDASMRFVSSKPTVVLARGATASFVLEVIDAGNYPAARCRPVTAAGLRVFPPHSKTSKLIPFPLPACARAGAGYLAAQAVHQGP
jgi:Domain of unknown function (DUF4232)